MRPQHQMSEWLCGEGVAAEGWDVWGCWGTLAGGWAGGRQGRKWGKGGTFETSNKTPPKRRISDRLFNQTDMGVPHIFLNPSLCLRVSNLSLPVGIAHVSPHRSFLICRTICDLAQSLKKIIIMIKVVGEYKKWSSSQTLLLCLFKFKNFKSMLNKFNAVILVSKF